MNNDNDTDTDTDNEVFTLGNTGLTYTAVHINPRTQIQTVYNLNLESIAIPMGGLKALVVDLQAVLANHRAAE